MSSFFFTLGKQSPFIELKQPVQKGIKTREVIVNNKFFFFSL